MATKKPVQQKQARDLEISETKGGAVGENVKGGVKKSAPCKKAF